MLLHRFLLLLACAVLCLPAPGPLHADEVEDRIVQWYNRFWEYYRAGKYQQAEKIARDTLVLCERYAAERPALPNYALECLAEIHKFYGRLDEAEKAASRRVQLAQDHLGDTTSEYANALAVLGDVQFQQGLYAKAQATHEKALAILEAAEGKDSEAVAAVLWSLAWDAYSLDRFQECEEHFNRALRLYEKARGADDAVVADLLDGLADFYRYQSRFDEALKAAERGRRIRQKVLPADHVGHAESLAVLASIQFGQGKYAQAEKLLREAREIYIRKTGAEHPRTAHVTLALAYAIGCQNRYPEAEKLVREAHALRERLFGDEHESVAESLEALGELYGMQGRFAEAESLLTRALAILERVYGVGSIVYAESTLVLADVYEQQGRYAEAEALVQGAYELHQEVLGPRHRRTAYCMCCLANLQSSQGHCISAAELYEKSLAVQEATLARNHPDIAWTLYSLAHARIGLRQFDEASRHLQRAREIFVAAYGQGSVEAANAIYLAGYLEAKRGQYAQALPLYRQSIDVFRAALGDDAPNVAATRVYLAEALLHLGQTAQVETELDAAIAALERSGSYPYERHHAYDLRAQAAWLDGRRSEALADLRRSMDIAEQQRTRTSGAERERASAFQQFSAPFERMVAWQTELGDATEALTAIERARARSLLDELSLSRMDLNLGRSETERRLLQQREAELQGKISALEKQLEKTTGGTEADQARRLELQEQLTQARAELYAHLRDARSSSPVFRNFLSAGGSPPRLSQLRRELLRDGTLLLAYLLGKEGAYVVAVDAQQAHVQRLELDSQAAAALHLKPGPLTAESLRQVLMDARSEGVLQLLSQPKPAPQLTAKLAALWRTLLPEDVRVRILRGEFQRLVVVPDGPLSLLPLDTLVVDASSPPRYLLDVGPPILYAPSATVLFNLAQRAAAKTTAENFALTIGNPRYGGPADTGQPAAQENLLAQLTPRSRYRASGGSLAPLPFSGIESSWVAQVVQREGLSATQLQKEQATEAALRSQIANYRLVHLACHGMAEAEHGNLFGALMLTPGGNDAANDGCLTLAEIYTLDLKRCELAILSACQTNFGPDQQGEGVWSISRGFLVAGAKRVVCSNWLVDDEAAASLVSLLCGSVAKGAGQNAADYAQSLHQAKRWVRKQQKWEHPYFWGTFVLVGPAN